MADKRVKTPPAVNQCNHVRNPHPPHHTAAGQGDPPCCLDVALLRGEKPTRPQEGAPSWGQQQAEKLPKLPADEACSAYLVMPSKQIALCLTRRRGAPCPCCSLSGDRESQRVALGALRRRRQDGGLLQGPRHQLQRVQPARGTLRETLPRLSSHRSFGSCPQKLAALPMKVARR